MAESLLTPQELANFLGIPVKTIYQWRTLSRGPRGIRVGKHLRYRRADVETWLDPQADTPQVPAR
jgi:excisionase family DNA binding protein